MATRKKAMAEWPPRTPDGRYIVVRGRLWRATNPKLSAAKRKALTRALMDARRAIKRSAAGSPAMKDARRAVQTAKEGLGERGKPWWKDGARDYNRFLAKNTPYATWFAGMRDV